MRYFFKDTVNSQNHLARKRHCGTSRVITFELSLQLWKKVLYEILNISIEPRWSFQTFIHVITWISLICSKEELNCPSVMLIRFSSVHLYVAYFTIKTVYIVKSEIKKKDVMWLCQDWKTVACCVWSHYWSWYTMLHTAKIYLKHSCKHVFKSLSTQSNKTHFPRRSRLH